MVSSTSKAEGDCTCLGFAPGGSLSGGQRQRVALARAVACRPSLLLLDEATSHLDAITESAVDRNLDTLSCTRVVIAHRLSTIENADLIVVLENGSIAEQGSHQELLALGGHYSDLVANMRLTHPCRNRSPGTKAAAIISFD